MKFQQTRRVGLDVHKVLLGGLGHQRESSAKRCLEK